MFTKFCAAVEVRLRTLMSPVTRDRGEGPVPHLVMVAIMAAAAVAVAVAVWGIADIWVGEIPDQAPAGPAGP
ncbi:hypothetical protein [Catellatospora coxensis]|uniref:Uncharacterized protein n=1 Tax=Catellatospora coxensis TaxID=310354 RepID=A0A8J3KQB2_9ACTN|nr:hypothetical protein [Catellatospora coxensis]GIG04303.1 hypothetical protein Cco03nite_10030 [Catellatospora coxensis]